MTSIGGTALGDIALVPGLSLKHPKGIRDIEEWYISTVTRRDYIKEVFERQTEIALENLRRIFDASRKRVRRRVYLRDGLRHAVLDVLLAGQFQGSVPAVLPKNQRLDPREHDVEDFQTLLRGGRDPH